MSFFKLWQVSKKVTSISTEKIRGGGYGSSGGGRAPRAQGPGCSPQHLLRKERNLVTPTTHTHTKERKKERENPHAGGPVKLKAALFKGQL